MMQQNHTNGFWESVIASGQTDDLKKNNKQNENNHQTFPTTKPC